MVSQGTEAHVGFIAGPVSFQRLFITGKFHDLPDDEFFKKVKARGFGRSPATVDDAQVGWIGPRHLFDTEIEPQHCVFGSFVLLSVRVDRLKIPASVLKAYVRMEEDAAREASGRDF